MSTSTGHRAAISEEETGGPLAHLGPNWFASVMGTGIVANAALALPVRVPVLHLVGLVWWVLASALLLAVSGAWAVHWVRHRPAALRHAADPVMAQFYGAPPMALLTVGAGALLVGREVLGEAAVGVAWLLWLLGTVSGLVVAVRVTYLMFTRLRLTGASAFGGWLMPVVPPMVSAATAAPLVPLAPAGQAALTLLLAGYALFGVSLLASLFVTTLIWQRLALHKLGAPGLVPTVWIVLGWLGQSVTATNALGDQAHLVLPVLYAEGLEVLGLAYGVPVFGFALFWLVLASVLTLRTARSGMPFGLAWWSFTFPVGTVVTGASALAVRTGAVVLVGGAVLGYLGLLAAWVVVTVGTVRGLTRGELLRPA